MRAWCYWEISRICLEMEETDTDYRFHKRSRSKKLPKSVGGLGIDLTVEEAEKLIVNLQAAIAVYKKIESELAKEKW